jgi:hypothetical protein
MDAEATRQLTEQERSVIAHLLSVEFDGVTQLRVQLERASVLHTWWPKGSPSFDIKVPADLEASPIVGNMAPIQARVFDDGGRYAGELLLWVTEGKLSALEYSWVTDEPPRRLPEIANIAVSVR